MNKDTLGGRFDEEFGDVQINESRNGSYQELGDLYGQDLKFFFKKELERLADEAQKLADQYESDDMARIVQLIRSKAEEL